MEHAVITPHMQIKPKKVYFSIWREKACTVFWPVQRYQITLIRDF